MTATAQLPGVGLPAVGAVPAVGEAAPDFELVNQFGEPVRLSDFRGRNVVVVFYPFAFSGICTGELCEIRDNLSSFEAADAAVLAISVDSKFAQRAYAEQESYDFDLLRRLLAPRCRCRTVRGLRRGERNGQTRYFHPRRRRNRPLRGCQSTR